MTVRTHDSLAPNPYSSHRRRQLRSERPVTSDTGHTSPGQLQTCTLLVEALSNLTKSDLSTRLGETRASSSRRARNLLASSPTPEPAPPPLITTGRLQSVWGQTFVAASPPCAVLHPRQTLSCDFDHDQDGIQGPFYRGSIGIGKNGHRQCTLRALSPHRVLCTRSPP